MGSNWPAGLDTFYNPTGATLENATNYDHAQEHSNENDAILALQKSLLGVTSLNLWNYATNDKVLAFDGAMTSGSTAFTSSFVTAAAVGKSIVVDGAGASGGVLVTTVSSVSGTTATLAAAAGATVSAASAVWGTDDTGAWNSMMSDWYSRGGGVMTWKGITLILGQVTVTNDGVTAAPANGAGPPNAGATVGPYQPPGRVCGVGEHWDGQWGGTFRGNASLMVVASTSGPCFLSQGTGTLELDHFTALMLTPDAVRLYEATNTTTFAHHGATIGRPSKLRDGTVSGHPNACTQEVFLFGGTSTTIGAGASAPYQGYGSSVTDWFFDRIRHGVITGNYANALVLKRLTFSRTCGTTAGAGDGPIYMNTSTQNTSHHIEDIFAEMTGYPNGFACILDNQANSTLINVIPVDATTTPYIAYFGPGSTGNLVINGYRQNTAANPISEDPSVAGKNRYLSGLPADSGTCVAGCSSATSINSAGPVTIPVLFNSAVYDPGAMLNTSTGLITIKIAGDYIVTGQVAFNTSSGQVGAVIEKNGVDTTIGGRFQAGGTTSTASASAVMHLAAGDTIGLNTYQTSGTTQNTVYQNCLLSISRVW